MAEGEEIQDESLKMDQSDFDSQMIGGKFDPLSEPTIQRDYTKSNHLGGGSSGVEDAEVISETKNPPNMPSNGVVYKSNQPTPPPPEPTIAEPSYAEPEIAEPTYQATPPPPKISHEGFEEEQEQEDQYSELTDSEKRKMASKTADMFISAYVRVRSIPFKSWGKFSEKKVNALVMADEMNLQYRLPDGQSVGEFISTFNKNVDDSLVMDDEQKKEIKSALVDVLLEQNVMLTPTQRLMMAVGMDLIGQTQLTMQNAAMVRDMMNLFQERHHETRPQQRDQPRQSQSASTSSHNQSDSGTIEFDEYLTDENIEIEEL